MLGIKGMQHGEEQQVRISSLGAGVSMQIPPRVTCIARETDQEGAGTGEGLADHWAALTNDQRKVDHLSMHAATSPPSPPSIQHLAIEDRRLLSCGRFKRDADGI